MWMHVSPSGRARGAPPDRAGGGRGPLILEMRGPFYLRDVTRSQLAGKVVVDEGRRGEIDRDEVIGRLGGGTVRCRVILDAQLLRVHENPQIAVLLVVVVFERDSVVAFGLRKDIHEHWCSYWSAARDGLQAVAPVAADDEWDLPCADRACVALIVVRVAGQHSVRPDAGAVADGVDLLEHDHAAGVSALRVWRMVNCNDDCPFELFFLDTS